MAEPPWRNRRATGATHPVTPTPTELTALCREAAEEIRTFATGRKIQLECESKAPGIWDPNRITQAVSNLVGKGGEAR